MMVGFFDDSGDFRSEGYSYLCGFISSVDEWNAFGPLWQEQLERYELPFLHTADFLAAKGDHRGVKYDHKERCGIIAEFMAITRKSVRGGFAIGIDPKAYKSALGDNSKHIPPDEFCLLRLIRHAHDSILRGGGADCLEFSFDESDKNAHRFLTAWSKLKARRDDIPRALFTSILFGDDKFIMGLQAADMLGAATKRLVAGQLSPSDALAKVFLGPEDAVRGRLVQFELWNDARFRATPQLALYVANQPSISFCEPLS